MYNPNPVPSKDLVANFVNSLENISGSIPAPVSLTLTRISLPISSFSTLIDISPSFVNVRAFLRRFEIT